MNRPTHLFVLFYNTVHYDVLLRIHTLICFYHTQQFITTLLRIHVCLLCLFVCFVLFVCIVLFWFFFFFFFFVFVFVFVCLFCFVFSF